jgi:hypothetical protein
MVLCLKFFFTWILIYTFGVEFYNSHEFMNSNCHRIPLYAAIVPTILNYSFFCKMSKN